jgi:hypothetical protein
MRGSFSKIAMMLALVWGCSAWAGCGGQEGGSSGSSGSGGVGNGGGAGGAGGSGAITDAGSGGSSGTVGCLTTPPTSCPTPPVTYSMVKPIFDARCVSVCHNGTTPDPKNNNEPIWGLVEYSHISDWRDTIRREIAACSMPPPEAGVPMTIEERKAIMEFIRCGLPQ